MSGRTLTTYNLHLESRENDALRVSQLNEVLSDAVTPKGEGLTLIAGDLNLNAAEGEAAAALKQAGFLDVLGLPNVRTRPARGVFDRGRSIDWIFSRGPIRVSQSQVHRSVSASDHYPLSVTLAFA